MIPAFAGTPISVRVLVATRSVDFRKGMDGLAALVKDYLLKDPYSGVVNVFRAKRADRVKMIWWDGTGLWLLAKTLWSKAPSPGPSCRMG
jgi:transposase